jgi:murein DD-endopeptidase MepM/ murein hydrolase activator NlpD
VLLLFPQSGVQTVADLTARPVAAVAPATAPAPVHAAINLAREVPSTESALWQKLTAIEDTVLGLETRLQTVSALASQTARDAATVTPPHAAPIPATNPPAAVQGVAVQLENALQTEYAFFVNAAKSPDQQHALLSATQTAAPEIRDVVLYNVQAVKTQLAEEAAIENAQQTILAAAGPAPTTLSAPLAGPISQGFGPTDFALEPPFAFGGVTYPHFHTGLDIAGPLDAPVHAAADGVVVIAGASTDSQGHLVGYGNYVVIAHGGKMVTLYGHLDGLLVHPGQAVHAGDVIGSVGSTGYSTGPHLHFEVRVGGFLADPMKYLTGQPHRL